MLPDWKKLENKLVHLKINQVESVKKEGYVTQEGEQAYDTHISGYLCELDEYVNFILE